MIETCIKNKDVNLVGILKVFNVQECTEWKTLK